MTMKGLSRRVEEHAIELASSLIVMMNEMRTVLCPVCFDHIWIIRLLNVAPGEPQLDRPRSSAIIERFLIGHAE
jgi:hypothetical protein